MVALREFLKKINRSDNNVVFISISTKYTIFIFIFLFIRYVTLQCHVSKF